ncbi:hypothetical protein EMIT0P253_40029 [Pseudomonas sp. IT-P253]
MSIILSFLVKTKTTAEWPTDTKKEPLYNKGSKKLSRKPLRQIRTNAC